MFDRTVTLYNYRKSEHMWYATVVRNCSLTMTDSLSLSTSGAGNSSSANIVFHCDKDKNLSHVYAPTKVVLPKAYQNLPSAAGYATFTPESDFMVVDYEAEESSVDDLEYDSGFYHYMNDKYDNVYMITDYAFFNLLPHFNVGGR